MSRGIDHLVIAVRGLDRARALYERLGFTLTPKARHPFGTENHLVQLDGCFLELLGIADPDAIPVPEPGQFSFPRFNARYLERREGMSMLVLDSADAQADARAFATAGIQSYQPFEFGRDARQPDGRIARVGFRLAFASDPFIPEAAFFTCQQLAPQYFWKPEYQRHANTAKTVTEAVMVADAPGEHRAFLAAFTGAGDIEETGGGLAIATARGTVRVETPATAEAAWDAAIPLRDDRTPRFAAFVIGVEDLAATAGCLDAAAIPHDKRGGRLVVPASAAMGAAVAFEEM